MFGLTRNVWVLLIAGGVGLCSAPLMVFVGGIVGAKLAPVESMATLPVAAIVVGTALAVLPVTRLMQRHGRKAVFIANGFWSACASLLAAWSISNESFVGFILASLGLGSGLAVIQQYRFAAIESVAPEKASRAVSIVLLGGLFSAVLGPELITIGAAFSADTSVMSAYVRAFVTLAGLMLLNALVMSFYYAKGTVLSRAEDSGRSMREIANNAVFWVAVLASAIGYAVMSYIMTATPISMHVVGQHSLHDTKFVIQSHILAMFLPSLVSGWLIERFGVFRLMLAGLSAYTICLIMALMGQDMMHYWLSLVLLGIGWNFLFVSGTVLLPKSYEAGEQFRAQGFHDVFVFVAQGSASILSGIVIFALGWNLMVLFVVPLIMVQLFMLFLWKTRRETTL